jgi:signal transduction histidine kinase
LSPAASSLRDGPARSHRQTRVLLWAGFGGLLLLLGVLGVSAVSFLYQIEIRQEQIRRDYVERDRTLEKLRSSIYLSGTYARDFMLDASESVAARHRSRFLETRHDIETGLSDYRRLVRPGELEAFQQLSRNVTDYLDTIAPALSWTFAERRQRGYQFIEQEVLPRRMMAVGLADQIQQFSDKQLEVSSQAVSDLFASFRVKLLVLLVLTILTGILLAALTLPRLLRLERQSQRRFDEILHAQAELKRLSSELVSAQESERRKISRELHDEVGQVLSAMMLGLGNVRSALTNGNTAEAQRQLDIVQDMTQRNVSVVRNISLLLRPTMLDDLGLVPALKWLSREVSRNSSLQVDVMADDCPDDLGEEHRTCIYRVVQEAVRNAERHSGGRQVRICVQRERAKVRVSVQDDGRGFNPSEETGLGLLGVQERVIRLGGALKIASEPGRGTMVSFELPVTEDLSGPPSISGRAEYDRTPLRTT